MRKSFLYTENQAIKVIFHTLTSNKIADGKSIGTNNLIWQTIISISTRFDNLLIAQPSSGEEALEITEMLVRSNAVDIIILDSVAALTSKAEIDGDMGDSTVGMQARLMSQAMRKLTPVVSKSRCVCIFINQIREKIGIMFGNPETTPGGRALKFFSSVRLDFCCPV